MNIEQKIADFKAKINSILANADANAEGVLSAEEDVTVNSHMSEIESLKSQLETRQKFSKLSVEIAKPQAKKSNASFSVIKDNDESFGFKSINEFLDTVMKSTFGRNDERLDNLRADVGSDEKGTWDNTTGGFFIPKGVVQGQMLGTDKDMQLDTGKFTTKVPMEVPSIKFDARVDKDHRQSVTGGFKVYRRAEAQKVEASKDKYEQVKLDAYELMGVSYATYEQIKYSPRAIVAIIQQSFGKEFTSKTNEERMWGNGVGEYLGFMNHQCQITVPKESGQLAKTVSYANLLAMYSRCYKYGSAIWVANQDALPAIAMITAPDGSLIWKENARDGFLGTLLGRPLFFDENAETLGKKGDLTLNNFSEYLEGELEPMQGAESIHVRFLENEKCFKFYKSNGGTPWWRNTLKPKRSVLDLSPFVALADR